MERINWKTELRRIEREFDGLPPEPTPEERAARRSAEQRAQLQEQRTQEQRQERYTILSVWARLVLVAVLAGAVSFWPYSRTCGIGLFAYMGAAVIIVVGGLWACIYAWHFRMALVHGLALATILWGLILFTAQVLPRNGYAAVDPSNPPTWFCRSAARAP